MTAPQLMKMGVRLCPLLLTVALTGGEEYNADEDKDHRQDQIRFKDKELKSDKEGCHRCK